MADKAIPDLTDASALAGADTFHCYQGGNSREASKKQITAWILLDSWTHSIDVTEKDFTGLDGYSELLIIAQGVTKSVSGTLNLRVSSDGGSSFYSSSGDYISLSTAGAASNATAIAMHSTSATAARTTICRIDNFQLANLKAVHTPTNTAPGWLIAQVLAMNAIRILPSGGGNLTGGSIYVFGR